MRTSHHSFIIGISAFFHDSAAALVMDGKIIAAAQEERFTRKKHDSSFPTHSIKFILNEAGISLSDIEAVAFYEKPYIKFERLLETHLAFAPMGFKSFAASVPVWIKDKLFIKKTIKDELLKIDNYTPSLFFPEHHLSHAASAFFPSPYEKAAILTIDGVGEWSTTTIGVGEKNKISILKELNFPHSLGLLYSAFTYYCGFKVNSGEYKLMGLAPYGNAHSKQTKDFKNKILTHLIDLREDGSFLLNMDYFNYTVGLTMTKDSNWKPLFGQRRKPESEITQHTMNLALAIQQITEKIILKLAKTTKKITKCNHLVLAGGVALNCVANGKILKTNLFDEIWIPPAPGDAGGALGAALSVWHISKEKNRSKTNKDIMQGSCLGPSFREKDIKKTLNKFSADYTKFDDLNTVCEQTATYLDQGLVVGWFQGNMEFGPRALGNRSILGDARNKNMQKKLNLNIKYREGFRPFAPIILKESLNDFFDIQQLSPYMLFVAQVLESRRTKEPNNFSSLGMYDRLYHVRSDIPAITHVDYSARIQSVCETQHPLIWKLLKAFEKKTHYPILINTSFNIRGEPIVCTPEDAYRCFIYTEIDILVLGNIILKKENQPKLALKDKYLKTSLK